METVLLVIHLLVAASLIVLILLQRSEGGALGIGGSGGGGGSLFSARGVGNALTRTTAFLAVAFFATSIGLTMLATHKGKATSVFSDTPVQTDGSKPAASSDVQLPKLGQETAPAAPAQPAAPAVPTNN
jgi:preprotein translocase subunit SecG